MGSYNWLSRYGSCYYLCVPGTTIGAESALSANILISKCLLPVERGVVHVPVVNLGEKDQWLRPKTFLGQLYKVDLQSVLDTELEERVVSQEFCEL